MKEKLSFFFSCFRARPPGITGGSARREFGKEADIEEEGNGEPDASAVGVLVPLDEGVNSTTTEGDGLATAATGSFEAIDIGAAVLGFPAFESDLRLPITPPLFKLTPTLEAGEPSTALTEEGEAGDDAMSGRGSCERSAEASSSAGWDWDCGWGVVDFEFKEE